MTEDAPTVDTSNTDAPLKRRALDSIDSNALFSGGRSRRPIAGLREFAISMNSRRNAATSSHLIRGIASAAIDQDDSGTYDPNEDRAKPTSSQLKRVKKAKIPDDAAEENATGTSRTKDVGDSGLVTLSFNSKEALQVLGSLPPGPFNDHTSDTVTIGDDSSSDTSTILGSPKTSSIILSTKRKSTRSERHGKEEEKYVRSSSNPNTTNNNTVTISQYLMNSLKTIRGAGAVKLASNLDIIIVHSSKMLILIHAPSVLKEASTVSLSFLRNSRRFAGDARRSASPVPIK